MEVDLNNISEEQLARLLNLKKQRDEFRKKEQEFCSLAQQMDISIENLCREINGKKPLVVPTGGVKITKAESLKKLEAALTRVPGQRGLSCDELAAACGKSNYWVYTKLAEMEAAGKLIDREKDGQRVYIKFYQSSGERLSPPTKASISNKATEQQPADVV